MRETFPIPPSINGVEQFIRPPLLKALREQKRISRRQISKLTRLSTYQVEGLEGEGTKNFLNKFFTYVKALGYRAEDVFRLIESDYHGEETLVSAGALGKPLSEVIFEDGVKFLTYLRQSGCYFGQLQLAPGKQLRRGFFPASDRVFGIVCEGTVVIDTMVKQSVHKKDHFFGFAGNIPAEFINGDPYIQTSVLLYLIEYPR